MKVFISHSHNAADHRFARELAGRLRSAGFTPFLDLADVSPGQNWARVLGRALDESDAMVVLISPDALESPWVRREIDYALTERRFEGRLIPVVTRPTREIPWVFLRLSPIDAAGDHRGAARRVVDALKRADAAA